MLLCWFCKYSYFPVKPSFQRWSMFLMGIPWKSLFLSVMSLKGSTQELPEWHSWCEKRSCQRIWKRSQKNFEGHDWRQDYEDQSRLVKQVIENAFRNLGNDHKQWENKDQRLFSGTFDGEEVRRRNKIGLY